LLNKYLVRAATSAAMDGAAPDLGRDRPVEGKAACTRCAMRRYRHYRQNEYSVIKETKSLTRSISQDA